MMNLRGFLMCCVAYSIAIQPAKAELPGLFSYSICSSRQSDIVKPWCHCKAELELVDDIASWCRSYERFSKCVETSLQKNSTLSTQDLTNRQENSTLSEGFLNQVFDKRLMDKRMKYLCSEKDFHGVQQCSAEISSCQETFRQQLSDQQQWDTKNACSITETLGSCIWKNKLCPPKLKHLLARFSDSYTTSKCTKYFKKSVGDKCVNMRREQYPNTTIMDTCLKGIQVQVSCLNREMMDSEHSEDMFYNIDTDRTNVFIYETFRCENIQLHWEKPCFHESSNKDRKCLQSYTQGQNNFQTAIRNGDHIPIENICSFFNQTTECFKDAHPNCHHRSNHLVAIFCTAFPKSCECPLGLTKEYADRFHKDGHSTSYSRFPNISLLLCTFVLCTFFVSPKHKYF